MAQINKKLIHINSNSSIATFQVAANAANSLWNDLSLTNNLVRASTSNTPASSSKQQLAWNSIVWFKATNQIWTHGKFYNCLSDTDMANLQKLLDLDPETLKTFKGATSSVAGKIGLVPAPTTSDVAKFLSGDGSWKTAPVTMVVGKTGNVTSIYNDGLSWSMLTDATEGNPRVMDSLLMREYGANRADLAKDGIVVEYTNNGGTSWATKSDVPNIFHIGNNSPLVIGNRATNGTQSLNDGLRITVDTQTAKIYTIVKRIAFEVQTNGVNAKVKVELAKGQTPTTWTTYKTQELTGWPGLNCMSADFATYKNEHNRHIRFTFTPTTLPSTTGCFEVRAIGLYGGSAWVTPSWTAKYGVPFDIDKNECVYFPAAVTINNGNSDITCRTLHGNARTANKWASPINLKLEGAVTGTAQIQGVNDVTINTTLKQDINISDLDISNLRLSSDKITPITGYTERTGTTSKVANGDTLNIALGKLQGQIGNCVNGLADKANLDQVYTKTQVDTELDLLKNADSGFATRIEILENKSTVVPDEWTLKEAAISGIGGVTTVTKNNTDTLYFKPKIHDLLKYYGTGRTVLNTFIVTKITVDTSITHDANVTSIELRDLATNKATTASRVYISGSPMPLNYHERWVIDLNNFNYDTTFPKIELSELDTYFQNIYDTPALRAKFMKGELPTHYTIISGTNTYPVGTLQILSDNSFHNITQVFTTHYHLTVNGFSTHEDTKIFTYYRSYAISSTGATNLGIPQNSWSDWKCDVEDLSNGANGQPPVVLAMGTVTISTAGIAGFAPKYVNPNVSTNCSQTGVLTVTPNSGFTITSGNPSVSSRNNNTAFTFSQNSSTITLSLGRTGNTSAMAYVTIMGQLDYV